MIKLEFQTAELEAALERLARSVANHKPIERLVVERLHTETEENFMVEGRPAWPDLADSTKKRRAKVGKWPGKKLQMSAGGLAASMAKEFGPAGALYGSAKKYAAIQQLGGKAGRGKKVTIPAREYVPVSADGKLHTYAEAPILEDVLAYLKRAMP